MKTIELSTYNSKEVLSNSEYTCTFPPVEIPNGASIQITQAFLDSNLSGAYQNIVIPEDLQISITFGLFYVNMKDSNKDPEISNVPFDMYVARHSDLSLYTDACLVTIPKDNYTPAELANLITKQVVAVPSLRDIQDISYRPGYVLKTSNINYSFPIDIKSTQSSAYEEDNYIEKLKALYTPVDPIIFSKFQPKTKIVITFQEKYGYPSSFSTTLETFDQNTGMLTFNPPSTTFLYTGPEELPYTNVSVSLKDAYQISFHNQTDANDSWVFTKPVYVGTNQFALEFDSDSGKFQFTQTHMPMYSTPTSSQPQAQPCCVVDSYLSSTGVTTYAPIDARTGVFFTNLQPASFWESLGFDLTSLLVVDDNVNHVLKTKLTRGVNITSQFFGFDGFISDCRKYPAPLFASYEYVTDVVLSIAANQQLPNADSGYYLIELKGLTTQYSTDNGDQLSSVMSIASKNYNQSGFITAYSDGSIPFVNTGEPFTLTSIKVRILDPITKQVVNTLGAKNSVFIQISP